MLTFHIKLPARSGWAHSTAGWIGLRILCQYLIQYYHRDHEAIVVPQASWQVDRLRNRSSSTRSRCPSVVVLIHESTPIAPPSASVGLPTASRPLSRSRTSPGQISTVRGLYPSTSQSSSSHHDVSGASPSAVGKKESSRGKDRAPLAGPGRLR